MRPASGEIAIQVNAMCDLLNGASVGEIVTFSAMSNVLGRDISQCSYILQKARRTLLDHPPHVRFDNVYKVGLKRMHISDAIGVADKNLRKIRRISRKNGQEISYQMAGANDIDERTKEGLIARIGLFGTIEALTMHRVTKAIEKQTDNQVLPYGRIIDILKTSNTQE